MLVNNITDSGKNQQMQAIGNRLWAIGTLTFEQSTCESVSRNL
jgi:hypothetical protein